MKSKTLRTITVVGALALVTVGFVTNIGIGTISAFGLPNLAILCPLGALGTMLAAKLLVPQALISLAIALILIFLLGRAFCAWVCPVPLVQKLRGILTRQPAKTGKGTVSSAVDSGESQAANGQTTQSQRKLAGTAVKAPGCTTCSSTTCASKRASLDSRHYVLGGALLATAIFGFPVFCLICPIGLTFGTILLFIRLFSHGDVTWSLIVIPLILAAEVLLFRKWCHKLCPLSALMSLVGKANRTFKPAIDDSKCLETAKGRTCSVCAKACPEGIDPRHPERSTASWSECTKCRACVDACPVGAMSMPFLPTSAAAVSADVENVTDESKDEVA